MVSDVPWFRVVGSESYNALSCEWKNEVSHERFRTFNVEAFSSHSSSVIVSHGQTLPVLVHRKQYEGTMSNGGER